MVHAYAESHPASQSYQAAATQGSRLDKKPEIRKRIEELNEAAAAAVGLNRTTLYTNIKELQEQRENLPVALDATRYTFKTLGYEQLTPPESAGAGLGHTPIQINTDGGAVQVNAGQAGSSDTAAVTDNPPPSDSE